MPLARRRSSFTDTLTPSEPYLTMAPPDPPSFSGSGDTPQSSSPTVPRLGAEEIPPPIPRHGDDTNDFMALQDDRQLPPHGETEPPAWTGVPLDFDPPDIVDFFGETDPPEPPPTTGFQPDQRAWDTDGYPIPTTQSKPPFPTAPPGYDQVKWNNLDHQTPKYVAGRIMFSFGDSHADPAVREQAIRALQQAYPGTTYNGKDKVDIPGVGVIDIYQAAGAGLYRPQWLDLAAEADEDAGNPMAGGAGADGGAGAGGPGGPGGFPTAGGGGGFPPLDFPIDPGVFGDSPVQAVGEDPLSQLITEGLATMIRGGGRAEGSLGHDLSETVRGLLERGGRLDEDELALRYETAREYMDRARRSQLNSVKGELASRNLLSEPGIVQGPDISAITNVEEALSPIYATELRNILLGEMDAADGRLETALGAATGISDSESRTLLDTLRTATDRQEVLSNIALGTLDRNMEWNRFLAELGLQRDVVLEQLRSGRVDQLLPLIAMFNQFANTARGGAVA